MSAPRLEVHVYDRHNSFLDVLPRRKGCTWKDALNASTLNNGFQLHRQDAKLLATSGLLNQHNIVKWALDFGSGYVERSGFRIETRQPTLLANGERSAELLTISGPDLLSFLKAGVIYPEGGLLSTSGDSRAFNYASKQGAWYNAANWAAPLGSLITTDTWRKPIYVSGWSDNGAYWIWPGPSGPSTTLPAGSTGFFRGSLTVATQTLLRVSASFDNQGELYLDDELILAAGPDTTQSSWRQTNTYDVVLSAGTHLFAAKVINAVQPIVGASNPAGFLFSAATLDANNNPATVLLRSDTTHWLSTTVNVGWRAAQILKTCVSEAQTRAVSGLGISLLTLGFTDTTDTAGQSWSDIQDVEFPIGTQKILEVMPQLCEIGPIDVAVTPALVLNAWKSRGTNRTTGATPVRLLPGSNLLEHSVSSQADLQTRLLTRSGAGWYEVADTTAESTYGRWEGSLTLGSTTSAGQTTSVGTAGVGITANPQTTYTSRGRFVSGATPYVDFDLGDQVQTVDENGNLVSVIVVGLTFNEDENGVLTFIPEFR